MSQISDYLEAELLKHIFRTGSFTKPSTIYIALCLAAPTDASTGSTISEPSGGSYARVQVGPSDATWSAVGIAGTTDNVAAITFPAATANWGLVTHYAICDAATAGNVLIYGTLATPQVINSLNTCKFSIGNLDVVIA